MAIKISRSSLKNQVGETITVIGRFVKKGFCKQALTADSTALFIDITDESGTPLTNHCWVTFNNSQNLQLNKNSLIKFSATVRPYLKNRKITPSIKGHEKPLKVSLGLVNAEILEVLDVAE
jgi:hypothetical protein